jgi:hypothetical protein
MVLLGSIIIIITSHESLEWEYTPFSNSEGEKVSKHTNIPFKLSKIPLSALLLHCIDSLLVRWISPTLAGFLYILVGLSLYLSL